MRDDNLIIDCFAGGGGASVGIELALGRSVDIAVNHDPQAIRMHTVNHPKTLHLTEDIFEVDLQKYVGGRHVALMWASPDCTQFSKAKGGKPRISGIRMLPWAVYKHAKAVQPDVIIMENVEEIQQWGPLDETGRPIKDRMGEEYDRFVAAVRKLGYTFGCRELIAADYGAPTTRKRWYAVFRRDGKPIVWPEQTHSKSRSVPGTKCWEPVWKYLDLMDLGKSIFGRKRPLAEKTMKRIAGGLDKFVFRNAEPFIMQIGYGERTGQSARVNSLHDPLGTIVGKQKHAYVSPMLIQYHSETTADPRGQVLSEPIRTIDTSNRYGLVSAFLTKFYKTGTGQSLVEPIHTITTSPGHFGQVSVLAVDWKHLQAAGIDAETAQKCTWVSQFIMEYYGCGTGSSLNDPLHTIVTKDRFALITVMGNEYCIMDIFLRMLNPKELKRAQGFPEDYIIGFDMEWKKMSIAEQVAKIGNSVSPPVARALVKANCAHLIEGERKPIIDFEKLEKTG